MDVAVFVEERALHGKVRQYKLRADEMTRPMASLGEFEDFRRQCERQLARPLADRIRFGFFRNPNPVRDAPGNRSFASMREYRRFCERSYPAYFGYARPGPATPAA